MKLGINWVWSHPKLSHKQPSNAGVLMASNNLPTTMWSGSNLFQCLKYLGYFAYCAWDEL